MLQSLCHHVYLPFLRDALIEWHLTAVKAFLVQLALNSKLPVKRFLGAV